MGVISWWAPLFEEPKGGYPSKKIQIILVKSLVNGYIGKVKKISATFAWPFGREKCTKKVRVNLTLPHGRKGYHDDNVQIYH